MDMEESERKRKREEEEENAGVDVDEVDDDDDEDDEDDDDDDDDDEDDDDEEESEDNTVKLDLKLDQNGRSLYRGHMNYRFQSYPSFINKPKAIIDLRQACLYAHKLAFEKIQPTNDDSEYSTGETIFLTSNEMDKKFPISKTKSDDPNEIGGPLLSKTSETSVSNSNGTSSNSSKKLKLGRLERLACDIFRFHTRKAYFDPERSGAEYWIQVLEVPTEEQDQIAEEDNEEECNNGTMNCGDCIAMHWDKDYTLEEECKVSLYPNLSTVTYLTRIGSPTVVVDNAIGPTVWHEKCLEGPYSNDLDDKGNVNQFINASGVEQFMMSFPIEGKHIAFDGRLLHGAPFSEFANFNFDGEGGHKVKKAKQNVELTDIECPMNAHDMRDGLFLSSGSHEHLRVTFLVNIWLNHIPVGARQKSESSSPMVQHSCIDENAQLFSAESEHLCTNAQSHVTTQQQNGKTDSTSGIKSRDCVTKDLTYAIGFGSSKTGTIAVPLPNQRTLMDTFSHCTAQDGSAYPDHDYSTVLIPSS